MKTTTERGGVRAQPALRSEVKRMEQEEEARQEKLAVDALWASYRQHIHDSFALATTLTYQKWLRLNHCPPFSQAFWREVRLLHGMYERARTASEYEVTRRKPETPTAGGEHDVAH